MVNTGIGSGNLDLLEILLKGPDVWNQWRIEHPFVQINLVGANLVGANLVGANLSGANLTKANLVGAHLNSANLSGANLRDADLISANLSKANLSGANLSVADLSGAYLSGANLREANLSGANLNDADLRGAMISDGTLIDKKWKLVHELVNEGGEGKDLSVADLSDASLNYANLRGADLRGANLRGANLRDANLRDANLRDANLIRADLFGADLSGAMISDGTLIDNQWRPVFNTETTPKTHYNFDIKVFDPDVNHSDKERLQAAIDRYSKASGYEEITVISEKSGSWFKKIRYRIAKLISQDIQEEAIQAGQEFYRSGKSYALNKLEKTGVESTKQIAEATAEILKAVENLDDVVLLLGKLIVMKYTNDDGRSKTYVKTISSDLQLKLESTPELLDSPQAIINFLKGQEELPPAIEDRKTLQATPEPPK